MITSQKRNIGALVKDIDEGRILLPELQRRYVWKSGQVRDLFDSLYRNYPSGQLLIWQTNDLPYSSTLSVDDLQRDQRAPQLLLDGQQRLTSLTAILLGKDLIVRGSRRPIDIAFNIFSEKFEVAGPRQRREPGWVSLKRLFTESGMRIWRSLDLSDLTAEEEDTIYERITRVDNIRQYEYNINLLEDLPYSEVTRIFVRVNSGGTKLNSADLALAQMSALWRGFTHELTDFQNSLKKSYVKLDLHTGILLRAISTMVTGNARLSQMFKSASRQITIDDLKDAWKRVKTGMEQAISFIANNCLIDRFDLLPTQYVLIPLTVFFDHFQSRLTEQQSLALQHWIYTALIWSRYSGPSETSVGQDVTAIKSDDTFGRLLQNVYDRSGKRPVTERELRDQRKNSPFMMMSYVLARKNGAEDWFNGVRIGSDQKLELHHIFPKAILKEKYSLRSDSRTVDQVANLAFLSQKANRTISKSSPSNYLPNIESGRLRDQYVPTDDKLLHLNTFEEFLLERRTRLAEATNELLSSLTKEGKIWVGSDVEVIENRIDAIEHQFRDLISHRFIEARGDKAVELVSNKILKSAEYNKSRKISANPFEVDAYEEFEDMLNFMLYSHLTRIMTSQWSFFADIFGDDPERFKLETGRMLAARNGLKHNQELNRSEKAAAEAAVIWLEDCLAKVDFGDDEDDDNEDEDEDEELNE